MSSRVTASVILPFTSSCAPKLDSAPVGSHGKLKGQTPVNLGDILPNNHTWLGFLAHFPQILLGRSGSWDTNNALGVGLSFPLGCSELSGAIFLDSPLVMVDGLYYIFK